MLSFNGGFKSYMLKGATKSNRTSTTLSKKVVGTSTTTPQVDVPAFYIKMKDKLKIS